MKVLQLPQNLWCHSIVPRALSSSGDFFFSFYPLLSFSQLRLGMIVGILLLPTYFNSRSLFVELCVSAFSDSTGQASRSLTLKKKAVDISPDLKGTCLFLVGINSSIKTNSAKLLADALRYYYFDSDSVVEEALGGKDAVRSFMKRDLKGFRDSETEVLRQLSSMGRLVVCAGNGAVQCATNLALLRHGISVWFDVPLDMVAKEVVEERFQLPAAETVQGSYSEVLTQLTALYEESRSGYATADATVPLQKVASQLGYDTLDAVTAEDMVLETLKEIEKLMRVKKLMEEAARPF